ncbi:nucleotide exchange factor GrpE [Thermoleophilia bacterium SCSIO 60948]|nr:nucleotide exchange factor GrpE [Thermoleophilia bacterium SCSIO 60948]
MPNSHASEEDGAVEAPEREGEPEGDRERDLEAELAEAEDRFKRARADLENLRKRTEREIARRVGEARDAIVRDWLEVIDSVERALRVAEPESPETEGYRRLIEQMQTVLDRHGIHRFGEIGERFDPERHEAVGVRETSEGRDRSVVEVARSGYAAGSQVLRPAQVIVVRQPPTSGPGEREG